ncbi:flagellar protein FliT [Pseudomonas indoloxydans]|uniref:Flagellar protein FliT n=1 Tax=Ectopseudomonas oleovorans TaxID=301 RepID=A0A2T5PIW5_ECTOL|nr:MULTISPECIES: flagellar protein FliT [Pseudomonas]MDM9651010.1 flagellar protein FliT [Pseudomonas wenzhouensis]PTU77649.1 flagellar protein FliT [Pseudomonas indoloxydans]
MNASVMQLQTTGAALRQALDGRDWEAIGKLDLQCRAIVSQAMVEPEFDQQAMSACMQELLDLYQDMIQLCRKEQGKIGEELMQLQQSRKGAQVYRLFG